MKKLFVGLFAASLTLASAGCGRPTVDEPEPVVESKVEEGDEVSGLAQNAKGGAVLLTSDGRVVYIGGLDAWPDDALNKQVRARGRLEEKTGIPQPSGDSEAIAGVGEGEAWVLREPEWSIVE